MRLTHSQLVGECSFDKRFLEFPLEYNMTVALVGRSSRKLCHKCSLCAVQSKLHQNIYLATFSEGPCVEIWAPVCIFW